MDVIDTKRSLAQGLRHYGTHALKQAGNTLVEQKMRQNLPILNAPLIGSILNKTIIPLVRRKVDSAIEGAVQNVLGQRGKGLVTDLVKVAKGVGPLMKSGARAILSRGLKNQLQKEVQQLVQTGAEQAIKSAAAVGTDILKGKNAKQAVQQRTSQAVKRTYDQMVTPILAKTGPRIPAKVPVKRKNEKRS